MKPASFDFVAARDMAEALAALREGGDAARVIAGGQSLVPMLNMRLATPATLVDISRIEELRRIESAKGAVTLGAAVRQAELAAWPDLAVTLPLIHAALPWVGHMQTRSRGTVCGSVAHADPSAELPLCLLVMFLQVSRTSSHALRLLALSGGAAAARAAAGPAPAAGRARWLAN